MILTVKQPQQTWLDQVLVGWVGLYQTCRIFQLAQILVMKKEVIKPNVSQSG